MQEIFSALSKRNSQPFVEAMADDLDWTVSGTSKWSRTYHGKNAVLTELLAALRSKLDGHYTNTAHRFIAENDIVVVECEGHSTTKAGVPYN
ncbi:MAG TPA: nuclear transport factor 2 family protein, partial [Pyrinomonadaceae bacterium]|nr:nuclear transport factor 2 family protein [Pyrinomonadaceae bacterium]